MTNNDIVARLRGFWLPNDTLSVIRDEAADEIERLRKERDEARKLLCDEIWLSRGGRMSVDAIAKERGWDCFKEASDERHC